MPLVTESATFRRLRESAKRKLGDTVDIWCDGICHKDVRARFRYNESLEFFEDMRARRTDLHVLIYCDELERVGIPIDRADDCVVRVDTKFLGDHFYRVEETLQQSSRTIRLQLGECSESRLQKATGKRISNAPASKGRIRNPYCGR